MLRRKSSVACSSAICLVLATPAFAQSQQPKRERVACSHLQDEMRGEMGQLNLDQEVQDRVDTILRQARQSQNEEQCLRTLQQANSTISRETGEAPIASSRFRQALQDARSTKQSGSKQVGEQVNYSKRVSASDAARIPVTFSNNLIGRSVQDREGAPAGELEYLAVDTASGDIRFAVIGSGGIFDIGEELTAVPWKKVNVDTWLTGTEPRIWLDASVDQLKQGRRITQGRIDQLTNPRFQTHVLTYYFPIDVNEDSASGRAQNRSQQDRFNRSDKSERSDGQMQRPRDSAQASDAGTAQGQDKQQQSADRTSQNDQTLMLVGRELITTLAPSQIRTGQQLQGATVETSDGREIGEIDRLVIDVERGKIAYALVAKGGFLGIGEEWRPVPLAALSWKSSGVYTLDQGQSQLEKMPKLTSDTLPSRIRQGDLKKLYEAHGLEPYWTQANHSSQRETKRNQNQ